MSAHANPNIITDSLVYMYDTGSGKSYKGEPTINYIHHQNAVAKDSYSAYSATSSGTYNDKHPNAIIAYNAAGTQMSGYYNGGVTDATNTHHAHWQYDPLLKKPVVVMNDVDAQWKAKWLYTSRGSWSSYGKGHGDTYTISWLQWVDHLSKNAKAGLYSRTTASVNGFHDGQANSASAYNTKLRTWQRVYQTYTTSSVRDLDSTYLYIYMYGMYNVRATVKVADVQFTWGDHPAQFSAEYERTATQALLDLTNTSTIDLSNVTFDSNSQMSFDGSNDIINTGLFSGRNPSTDPFTVEAMVKSDVASGNRIWVDATSNGSSQRFYSALIDSTSHAIGIQGSAWSDPTPSDTNWHHQVIVMDGNTAKAYNNGELASSKSYTSYTLAGGLNIGGRSGYPWAGQIPIFKIYDRALTQDEVSRNYNAIKSRFGL